jgi:nucleoside-diphosphate-sugar epimerase
MIIGSGLVATAFKTPLYSADDVWIYAAGVSNSGCVDNSEFERERACLTKAMEIAKDAEMFLYFSTCSIDAVAAEKSPYVHHKIAMEKLVANHSGFLIIRLPQLAGRTLNPHTLLNYLYGKITHEKVFLVWKNAYRNIIDIDDVVKIVNLIVKNSHFKRKTINIANPYSISILDIIAIMEKAAGRKAICKIIECGEKYDIDVSEIKQIISMTDIDFGKDYTERTIVKYYSNKNC